MKKLFLVTLYIWCLFSLTIVGCKKNERLNPAISDLSSTEKKQEQDQDQDIHASNDPNKLMIFMSPIGDDSRSGLMRTKPVKTLVRVHQILLNLRPTTDVEIHINQGVYKDQRVIWTFSNGKRIIFTPIDFSKQKPIFDGAGINSNKDLVYL